MPLELHEDDLRHSESSRLHSGVAVGSSTESVGVCQGQTARGTWIGGRAIRAAVAGT